MTLFADTTERDTAHLRETSQADRHRCRPCESGAHRDCHGAGMRDAAGEYASACGCWCRDRRERDD